MYERKITLDDGRTLTSSTLGPLTSSLWSTHARSPVTGEVRAAQEHSSSLYCVHNCLWLTEPFQHECDPVGTIVQIISHEDPGFERQSLYTNMPQVIIVGHVSYDPAKLRVGFDNDR